MKSAHLGQRHNAALFGTASALLRDFGQFAGRKGVAAGIAVLFGALLESVGLVLIIPLLGIMTGIAPSSGRLAHAMNWLFGRTGLGDSFSRLALVLGIFGAVMIARAVVIATRDVTLMELEFGFLQRQRVRIAERLAAAEWSQIVKLRHARIAHMMSGDTQRIGIAAHFLLQSIVAIAMIVAQGALALFLAPALAIVAFVLLAGSAAVLLPALRRSRDIGAFSTEANLSLLNTTMQFLGGLKLAVSQNLQGSFAREFDKTLHDLTKRQVDYVRQQTTARVALGTVSALVGAALFLVGYGLFHVAAPVLITLLLIVMRISRPAALLQQGALQLANALPAYETIIDLEKELTRLPDPQTPDAAQTVVPRGSIVFDNVTFLHEAENTERRGVRGISLTIEDGEIVGLGGTSGAGKTTLADLLAGLVRPQSGRIAVGGMPLAPNSLGAWREGLSYVSQDPFLFYDTVRRNLTWASPSASEDDLWNALALAGAEELLRRMEHGLDTVVGERGTLMSGGERQRIALARSLLRKPRLLILDEATSALDIAAERQVLERLRDLLPRPTVLVIAHRTEALALCDRVIWLDEGRIVDGPAN